MCTSIQSLKEVRVLLLRLTDCGSFQICLGCCFLLLFIFATIYILLFLFNSSLCCFHHHSAKMEMNPMKQKAIKKSKPILCLRLPFYSELLWYGLLKMLIASGLVLSEALCLIIKFISSTEKSHWPEKCNIYNFKKL